MKKIESLNSLKKEIEPNDNVWLLLFKKGSEQSDCAFENFKSAENKAKNAVLCYADVNEVRDIHPEFNINSAPSLLYFEKGKFKNAFKGCYKPEQFNAIFEKEVFAVPAGNGKEKPQKNVTVYTTPTCSWCTTIKRHLQENNIRFREVDVSADQNAAQEMVKKSGQQGVPQTDINGQVIVGFDKTRINSLLGIN
ncbi:MAG TPA: thioredoxin family protein [Prolixibacteraceae bacterium]|nr:thioredoxin family protein [Prolixibacteraceae bacterium]